MPSPLDDILTAKLRESARELLHEFKNHIGIATGSAELLMLQFEQATRPERRASVLQGGDATLASVRGPDLDWEKAHRNLGRILRALERMDAFTTMGQKLLRGEGEVPSRFELLALLESVDRDLAALRGLSATGADRRLVLCDELEQCDGLWALAPRADVIGLLGRMLTLQKQERIPVRLQALRESYVEIELGLSLPNEEAGGWSLAGERFKMRSWGGDLSWNAESCRLSFPLAPEQGAEPRGERSA